MTDYSQTVPDLTLPFTIQWREEIPSIDIPDDEENPTESGFEVYTLPDVITLEAIHHHGY